MKMTALKITLLLAFCLVFVTSAQAELIGIEPALGVGSTSLAMQVSSDKETVHYSATNTNFTFINLAYNGLSFLLKIPQKERPETLAAKGNSDVTDYQAAYAFTPQWQIELYYQRYKSYFIEYLDRKLIQPDLALAHEGGQVIYVANPDYSLAMNRGTSWKQTKDSGSWIYSAGIDHFTIDGDLTPPELETSFKSSMQNSETYSLSARINYGYNWIWSHWFTGLVGGLGGNQSLVRYNYSDRSDSNSNSGLNANYGMSVGYYWDRSKVGLFTRGISWSADIDDKKLSSTSISAGLYVSSVF